jgi:hypothetical protein
MLLPFLPCILFKRVCCWKGGDVPVKKLPEELRALRESLVREIKRYGSPSPRPKERRASRLNSINEADFDDMIVLQAAKTTAWVVKLYRLSFFVFLGVGANKIYVEYRLNEDGGVVQAIASLLIWKSGIYIVIGLCLLGFRNDFPFNLLFTLSVSCFIGYLLGKNELGLGNV